MAKFVKHEPCPSCGSRDNLGRYSDGSAFCFGCHYVERANVSPFVEERNGKTNIQHNESGILALPSGSTTSYPEHVVLWLGKYGISVPEALRAGFVYEPQREQLLFPFYNRNGDLCCIQAKNFNVQRASKAKYYNTGEKAQSWTIYGTGPILVMTEDAVSSLKVSRQTAAMPLLGTHISRDKLAALRSIYKSLIVWLDSDKWKEARDIADAAKLLGFPAKTILTPLDPKEYTNEEIQWQIQH